MPGAVDAWSELHKKFGKLKLRNDLAPAAKFADEGFPVTELIAFYWHFAPEIYKDSPGAFLETYTVDGKGRTPAKGQIFKNPALAKTLRLDVTGEGIETEVQHAQLRLLAVERAQGYLFARPQPADVVARLLFSQDPVPHAQRAASLRSCRATCPLERTPSPMLPA